MRPSLQGVSGAWGQTDWHGPQHCPLTECPLGLGFLSLCKVCLGRSPIVHVDLKLTGVSYSCARSGGGDGVRVVVEGCLEAEGSQKQ